MNKGIQQCSNRIIKLHICQEVIITTWTKMKGIEWKINTCVDIKDMMDELIKDRWPCCANLKINYKRNTSMGASLWKLNTGANVILGTNIFEEWGSSTRIDDKRDDDKWNRVYDCENGWYIFV